MPPKTVVCFNIMANIKSAKKRIAVADKKRMQNKAKTSELRTEIKKFEAKPSAESFKAIQSLLDSAVTDGIIHANKAGREKARLVKKVS